MTRWEIRLAEQPPIFVEVEDDRDLAEEFARHLGKRKRRVVDHWWRPTQGAGVFGQAVVSVHRRRPKRGTVVGGFSPDN